MGASSTKPIPQDATGSQRNLLEAQNAEAAETNERRKAAVTQMARQRMMLIEMSGGYTPGPLGGPVAGFLPHAPALELEELVEKHEVRPAPAPPGSPTRPLVPTNQPTPARAPAPSLGLHPGAAPTTRRASASPAGTRTRRRRVSSPQARGVGRSPT